MSFQAMTWAVDQDLKTNEKMVLIMLSNCTNHHTGQCNPSHTRLAAECGMSISTLKRCIAKLEEGGFLKIERREKEGVSLPNQYHLNIGFVPETSAELVGSEEYHQGQCDGGSVHSEPVGQFTVNRGSVHSEPGVGSERATKQEYNQEYNQEDKTLTEAEKSASVSGAIPFPVKPSEVQETELQAKCREAWTAYKNAYTVRYGIAPVRNAKVNAQVKQLVQRLGVESGPVAEFYVMSVNDSFIVKNLHDLGSLLAKAETYRTQWATGQTMTSARARQIDSTQANASAVDEAIAIARARRNQGKTYEQC